MPAADTSALPEGWISLPDCLLEPRPVEGMPATTILVPMALLHPEFGVALLGVPGAVAEAAAAAFRQRLDDARFPGIFPGHLPVVTLAMLPGEPLNLRRRLAAAFAAVPPLELAGGDGWISLVSRLLQTRPLVRPPSPGPRRQRPAAARQPEPPRPAQSRPSPDRPSPARPGLPWRTLGPMLGLAGGGLVIGLLLGLNHTPSTTPQSGADVPPRPTASAPPPPPQAEARPPQRQAAVQPPPPVAPAPAPAPAAPAVAAPPVAVPAVVRPPADPAPSLPRVLVRSAANLRAGPDSSAPILRTAARGEAFRVHGEARGGWMQVGGTAPEGWIHSSLLTEP